MRVIVAALPRGGSSNADRPRVVGFSLGLAYKNREAVLHRTMTCWGDSQHLEEPPSRAGPPYTSGKSLVSSAGANRRISLSK